MKVLDSFLTPLNSMKVSLLYHLLLGHSRLPLQSHLYKTSAVKGCNSKEVTTLQQHWFCKFIFLKTERLDQLVVFTHSNSFEYFHWSQNFGLGLNSEGKMQHRYPKIWAFDIHCEVPLVQSWKGTWVNK